MSCLPFILLPGLGADARLYAPHRRRLRIIVLRWPEPAADETLPAYAARLAATLPRGGGFILGGSSFGGMVAWEMASRCAPAALALIGSASSPDDIA